MNVGWLIKRLRAMGRDEVLWRVSQKKLSFKEKNVFKKNKVPVTFGILYPELSELTVDASALPLGDFAALRACPEYDLFIPGGYSYSEAKKDWHRGYQTDKRWPLIYSGDIDYRQRDDIGDARTAWELSRHFQFVMLSARYAATSDMAYLTELGELFCSYNDENPFLWGISWTSEMEIAIRAINWMYTLAFLDRADENKASDELELLGVLMESLSVGIINMVSHISNHFSRYSSANNHTIIEACALGLGGLMTGFEFWTELSDMLLFKELQAQNYTDGVNKEMSLHYQSFVMEGVGILALARMSRGARIPQLWRNILTRLSRYVATCGGRDGARIVFGDDDAGKILDIGGQPFDHYDRVLQLMSLILPERYVDEIRDLTVISICPENIMTTVSQKPLFEPGEGIRVYEQGGVSIFRGDGGRIIAGFDHGELGYGTIAAHGHADALSFQLFREGKALLADPGTYIYHIKYPLRCLFRTTRMHNTVNIQELDQSQMQGAFLWGKRAECRLISHSDEHVEAQHNGYFPLVHRRRIAFDGERSFIIRDRILNVGDKEEGIPFELSFIIGPCFTMEIGDETCIINDGDTAVARLRPECDTEVFIALEEVPFSGEYGSLVSTQRLSVRGTAFKDTELVTKVKVL